MDHVQTAVEPNIITKEAKKIGRPRTKIGPTHNFLAEVEPETYRRLKSFVAREKGKGNKMTKRRAIEKALQLLFLMEGVPNE